MKFNQFENILQLLEYRSNSEPNQLAYRFLTNKRGSDAEEITYQELTEKAKKIASLLVDHGVKYGDRVLINHLPGILYIISFFATLYAGGIAVPIYPPKYNTKIDRISMILKDSGAKIALTSSLIIKSIMLAEKGEYQTFKNLKWLETDIDLENIPQIKNSSLSHSKHNDTIFLQYTSGSTSNPKGVMLTNKSLLANIDGIYNKFEINPKLDHGVIWLPPYHDMGFIGGILVPLYSGFSVTLMSPFTFIQRPIRWLEIISKYKGTISGGPNFAYDLCIRRISGNLIKDLDLSSWRIAFCGAEPIHSEIMNKFTDQFLSTGFKKSAFYPCYGLAESTLIVTGGLAGEEPILFNSDRKKLENEHFAVPISEKNFKKNRIRTIVGCGNALLDHDIKIIDYKTKKLCRDGQIGEIWVTGASVAKGYWKLPKETHTNFEATYEGQKDNLKYLRTGDLGFIVNNEIYITGRIKDILIIRGKNFYPQDIEISINKSHELVKSGVGAVFSVETEEKEYLFALSEISKYTEDEVLNEIMQAIEEKVLEDHGLSLSGIQLLQPGSIPFTSSGKIMRQASKKKFLKNEFSVIKTKGITYEEVI